MVDKENQKIEAIKRMKALHIMPQVIKDFERNGIVYYSEYQNKLFNATLYWVSNNEGWNELISEFEKEHDALVYHAQLCHTNYGEMLSLLYVSNHEDEWEMDNNDIINHQAFVYCVDPNDPDMGEFGSIGIRPSMGGVVRTW